MKLLGFQIPNFTFPRVANDKLFDHVAMLANTAERAGFDSVWVMDHFYQLPSIGPRTEPMLEGYAILAGIAVRTESANRHPRDRRDVPQSSISGENGHDARHRVIRQGDPGNRRSLERG